jgi:hypothetical protein
MTAYYYGYQSISGIVSGLMYQVLYYSQSGNTRKIADAIAEDLA